MAQMTGRSFKPVSAGTNQTVVPSQVVFYDPFNHVSCIRGPRRQIPWIAVFIDGACRGNGGPRARAAYGVYFGQDSPRNSYGPLPVSTIHTNNKAEIFAAQKAVDIVLTDIGWHGWKNGVVLITDSDYLFQSMTNYINTWLINGFLCSDGRPVANADEIRALHCKICYLDGCGINVRFWRVDRVHNQDADRLAELALGPGRRAPAFDAGYIGLE